MMPELPQFKYWPPDLVVESTSELIEAYQAGFAGAIYDQEANERVQESLIYHSFADVAHKNQMAGDGKGELSLPYRVVQRLNPVEYPGPAQRTGCCVSRSTVNAFTASYAYEVYQGIQDESGQAERWPVISSPSEQTFDHVAIYGERGHRGQGAHCGTLAIAARDSTGLLPRGKYEIPGFGTYDCSRYDDHFAARSGPSWPRAFQEYVNQHHVRDVARIISIDEARDALANHYGLSVCSSFACGSKRPTVTDSRGNKCAGVNRWHGSWAHAMAWLACDDRRWAHQKYGGPIFLVCNSWGKWNSGPRRIFDSDSLIPEGSFWIGHRDASKMIAQGGAYVLSDVKGFPRRPLIVEFW